MATEKQPILMTEEDNQGLPSFEMYKTVVQHAVEVSFFFLGFLWIAVFLIAVFFFHFQHGRNALTEAVREKKPDVLRELLRLDLDFSSEEVFHLYDLHYFCEFYCIVQKSDALEAAVEEKDVNVVEQLLGAKADPYHANEVSVFISDFKSSSQNVINI